MAALPDINVHHSAAVAWLTDIQQDGYLLLCRISQLGLLRLLGNPVVMGADVQTGIEVWRTWDALLAGHRFRFEGEPKGFEARFRLLSGTFAHQPKRWQDAYLAAFALAAGVELVTFDAGFRTFPGLRHSILAPEAGPA